MLSNDLLFLENFDTNPRGETCAVLGDRLPLEVGTELRLLTFYFVYCFFLLIVGEVCAEANDLTLIFRTRDGLG